jgi:hypothetical protein
MLCATKAKSLETIKSLPSYPKIEKVVLSAGLKDIDDYYDASSRVMGTMYEFRASQMLEEMPEIDAIFNMMTVQGDKLK